MNRLQQIRLARKHGILNPIRAYRAARKAGIPYWVMCAFLMQETSGGQNIYGHDVDANGYPRPFWGHGEVTKENYAAYLKERNLGIENRQRFPSLGYRSQGVGPMQLTHWSIQDRADAAGGTWDSYTNMLIGATIIREYYDESSRNTEIGRWRYAAYKYNGKQSYVDSIAPKFDFWQNLLT